MWGWLQLTLGPMLRPPRAWQSSELASSDSAASPAHTAPVYCVESLAWLSLMPARALTLLRALSSCLIWRRDLRCAYCHCQRASDASVAEKLYARKGACLGSKGVTVLTTDLTRWAVAMAEASCDASCRCKKRIKIASMGKAITKNLDHKMFMQHITCRAGF